MFVWRPWQKLSPPAETATAVPAPAEPKAAPPEPAPAPIPPTPAPVTATERVATPPAAEPEPTVAGKKALPSSGELLRPRGRPAPGAPHPAPSAVRATGRPPKAGQVATAEGEIRIALSSDPPGAVVCAAGAPGKLGTTNGNFALRTDNQRATLLVYHPGYHIEKIVIPGDENVTRSVRLRPLTDDDLQPPPPCR